MSRAKPYLKESRYITALCVWVSSAEALIDCMRYDSCYPASEAESSKIGALISEDSGGRRDQANHIIRLIRVARTELPPTLDRWRSFCCYVLDVRHPQDSPLTDAELANLALINHGIHGAP